MIGTEAAGLPVSPSRWRRLTIAFQAGTVTMGLLAFVATLFQTPGLEGPVEIARIAAVVAVLGVTALPLVWWDDGLGYAIAAIAGGGAVLGVAGYLAGTFGPTRVAPAAYLFALFGCAVLITSGRAWRERSAAVEAMATDRAADSGRRHG